MLRDVHFNPFKELVSVKRVFITDNLKNAHFICVGFELVNETRISRIYTHFIGVFEDTVFWECEREWYSLKVRNIRNIVEAEIKIRIEREAEAAAIRMV